MNQGLGSAYNSGYTNESPYEKAQDTRDENVSSQIEAEVRNGFISKVYGIIFVQLLISIGFISLSFIDKVAEFLKSDLAVGLLIASCVMSFVVLIILGCCKQTARKVPTNYILLLIFTICESYYLLYFCSSFTTSSVITAAGLTAVLVFALTIYACKTKTDFTFCGPFLFCCLIMLIVTGIIFAITGFKRLYILYQGIGVVVFSIYLIYDTQLICGKFQKEFSYDDYVFAALNLYLDIIILFTKILAIIGNKK